MDIFEVKPLGKIFSLFFGDYSQFFLPPFLFFYIANNWSWGVVFTAGIKVFLGRVYYAWFPVWIFELIFFSLKIKISCGPDLLMGIMCWTISSFPGIRKSSFAFVSFGDGPGYFSITVLWSFLGISFLIIGIIILLLVSNLDIYFCCPYKLIWWYYVISLK